MPTYSTFNPGAKNTHVILDKYYMAVINGDSESPRDSAWRTAAGYKSWGDYHLYKMPLDQCIRKVFESPNDHIYHYQYRRHPMYEWGSDMSRDHVISLLLLAYFGLQDLRIGSLKLLRDMIDNTPYRITKKTKFTIDMWC